MLVCVLLLTAAAALAQDRVVVGLTASGSLIEAIRVPAPSQNAATVLLLGGFASSASQPVRDALKAYRALPRQQRKFHLLAIAEANP